MTPTDRKYTKSHEWLLFQGSEVTLGITDHAQHELTDIVFVELPEVGKELEAGDVIAVVESVKVAADIYTPIAGKVTAVNESLESEQSLINSDPYGQGWICKMETADTGDTLLDSSAYEALVD